ncbi:hypothetical protein R50072_21520 [Simiduia litorea]
MKTMPCALLTTLNIAQKSPFKRIFIAQLLPQKNLQEAIKNSYTEDINNIFYTNRIRWNRI